MTLREIARNVLITIAALTSVLSIAVLLHNGDVDSALPLLASASLTAVAAGILEAVGLST